MLQKNLEKYRLYCKKMESPTIYIDFSFYSLIASCLQRRVWLGDNDFEIYPNLYIVFVGEPGTGKTIATAVNKRILQRLTWLHPGKNMLEQVINIAADTTSVEALIVSLSKCSQSFEWPPGSWKAHASTSVISEELGNLFKENTKDLIRFLCQGFDAQDYKKETIGRGRDYIKKMCINLIAASNFEFMASATLNLAINEGLTSRVIFVAGGNKRFKETFYTLDEEQRTCFEDIVKWCQCLTTLKGKIEWQPEAKEYFDFWYRNNDYPLNPDRKLKYYYSRKRIHSEKLAIAIHFSDSFELILTLNDIKESLKLLAFAEETMHLALSGSGTNPLNNVTTELLKYLKDSKNDPPTINKIRLIFWNAADLPAINAAIEFLMITNQIKIKLTDKGENVYEAA